MNYLLSTKTSIPEGYEHLLEAKMPDTALVYPLVGFVLVLLTAIIFTIVILKKYKASMLPIFSGISIYMFFNYFIVGIVTMFMPANNPGLFIVLTTLVSAFVPFMGRLFFIKLFARRYNNIKAHFGYGIGIMNMRAVMNLLTFIYPIVYFAQINNNGVEQYFPADAEAELALTTAQNLEQILKVDYTQYILLALITIALMVYSLAATMPIYAAFKGKKSKAWYAFALGMGALSALAEVLYSNDKWVIPAIILAVVVAVVSVYVAIKLHNELAADEDKTDENDDDSDDSISKNAHVKIPKFSNLDKL